MTAPQPTSEQPARERHRVSWFQWAVGVLLTAVVALGGSIWNSYHEIAKHNGQIDARIDRSLMLDGLVAKSLISINQIDVNLERQTYGQAILYADEFAKSIESGRQTLGIVKGQNTIDPLYKAYAELVIVSNYYLADAYYKQARLDTSKEAFRYLNADKIQRAGEEIIAWDSSNWLGYRYTAIGLWRKQLWTAGEKPTLGAISRFFQGSIDRNDGFNPDWYNIAELHFTNGDFVTAFSLANKALEMNGNLSARAKRTMYFIIHASQFMIEKDQSIAAVVDGFNKDSASPSHSSGNAESRSNIWGEHFMQHFFASYRDTTAGTSAKIKELEAVYYDVLRLGKR